MFKLFMSVGQIITVRFFPHFNASIFLPGKKAPWFMVMWKIIIINHVWRVILMPRRNEAWIMTLLCTFAELEKGTLAAGPHVPAWLAGPSCEKLCVRPAGKWLDRGGKLTKSCSAKYFSIINSWNWYSKEFNMDDQFLFALHSNKNFRFCVKNV